MDFSSGDCHQQKSSIAENRRSRHPSLPYQTSLSLPKRDNINSKLADDWKLDTNAQMEIFEMENMVRFPFFKSHLFLSACKRV